MSSSDLIRTARRQSGISQRQLAIRAGTKQSTISRLEAGTESPTLHRLERLLRVMGYRLDLALEPLETSVDPDVLAASRRMSPEERLVESAAWNKFATSIEIAAAKAGSRPESGENE